MPNTFFFTKSIKNIDKKAKKYGICCFNTRYHFIPENLTITIHITKSMKSLNNFPHIGNF